MQSTPIRKILSKIFKKGKRVQKRENTEKEYTRFLKCREFLSRASRRPDDWENSELLLGNGSGTVTETDKLAIKAKFCSSF